MAPEIEAVSQLLGKGLIWKTVEPFLQKYERLSGAERKLSDIDHTLAADADHACCRQKDAAATQEKLKDIIDGN